jgi:hypothetical protein
MRSAVTRFNPVALEISLSRNGERSDNRLKTAHTLSIALPWASFMAFEIKAVFFVAME